MIIGTLFNRIDMFVDFALAYALLNFVGSLAAARYLNRTKPMPDEKTSNLPSRNKEAKAS